MTTEVTLTYVLDAIENLHHECLRSQRTLTVVEVASLLSMKRPTLYSRFPEAIQKIAELREKDDKHGRAGRPRDERIRAAEDRLSVIRRERDSIARELATYAERIRHLSIENARLRDALERQSGVIQIGSPPVSGVDI